jgi:hypothetical protein
MLGQVKQTVKEATAAAIAIAIAMNQKSSR